MIEQNEILERYNAEQPDGKEPIRLLKNVDEVEAWSNIPSYMVMLLTQLKMLNNNLEINMIEEEIIVPYLRLRLSTDGYARQQFKEAHSGLVDAMKPILAGMIPEDSKGLKREK